MGGSTAAAFGVTYQESALGLALHWPVGGARWRANGLNRFTGHSNNGAENRLDSHVGAGVA